MKRSEIEDIQWVSEYQVHVITSDKVILLDTTCDIEGVYFANAQEMIDFVNQI